MKALLINGSPHPKGCTYTALEELARTLEAEGIETEIVQAGGRPYRQAKGCFRCCGACGLKSADPTGSVCCRSSATGPVHTEERGHNFFAPLFR